MFVCYMHTHTHTHTFEEHLNAEVTIEGGIKHLKLVLCRPHWSDGPLLAVSCVQVFRLEYKGLSILIILCLFP